MSTVYYYQVIFDILDNPVAIMQNLQFGVGGQSTLTLIYFIDMGWQYILAIKVYLDGIHWSVQEPRVSPEN